MVEHHHRSALQVHLALADRSQWGSVANRPQAPDFDGRENVPDAAIPRRSDKEIYKIQLRATVMDGSSSNLPGVLFTDNRADNDPTDRSSSVVNSFGTGIYDESAVEWWPDVTGSAPQVDTHVIELESDPILWENEDLVHLGVAWPDGEIRIQGTLFWRHA